MHCLCKEKYLYFSFLDVLSSWTKCVSMMVARAPRRTGWRYLSSRSSCWKIMVRNHRVSYLGLCFSAEGTFQLLLHKPQTAQKPCSSPLVTGIFSPWTACFPGVVADFSKTWWMSPMFSQQSRVNIHLWATLLLFLLYLLIVGCFLSP